MDSRLFYHRRPRALLAYRLYERTHLGPADPMATVARNDVYALGYVGDISRCRRSMRRRYFLFETDQASGPAVEALVFARETLGFPLECANAKPPSGDFSLLPAVSHAICAVSHQNTREAVRFSV